MCARRHPKTACMVKLLRRERRQGNSRGNRNTMDIVSPSQTGPGHCGTNTIGNLLMDFGNQKCII